MKKIVILSILTLFTVIYAAGSYYVRAKQDEKSVAKSSPTTSDRVEPSPSPIVTPSSSSSPTPSAVPSAAPTPPSTNNSQVSAPQSSVAAESKLVPPMDNFTGRITLNGFGNEPSKMKVDPSRTDLQCTSGKNYPGFHTGVDLELTPQERNNPVSVFSISDGVVLQAGTVNGYGGLIVIKYVINGQTYTAYYGHTDVKTFTVKAGSKVVAGQKLAELAAGCTPGNGNTRKHLHFGIHKGSAVVVAGYVNTKAELNNWIDPRELIK